MVRVITVSDGPKIQIDTRRTRRREVSTPFGIDGIVDEASPNAICRFADGSLVSFQYEQVGLDDTAVTDGEDVPGGADELRPAQRIVDENTVTALIEDDPRLARVLDGDARPALRQSRRWIELQLDVGAAVTRGNHRSDVGSRIYVVDHQIT